MFAGALHVDINRSRRVAWQVGAHALVGTAVSTLIIGYGSWYLLGPLGIVLPLVYYLLFGALISPTDPIAVLGVLKSAHVPQCAEATIAGESLINDGVGVVLFALLLEMLQTRVAPTLCAGPALFAREALGGVAFGVGVGYLVFRVLGTIDDPQVEVLITMSAPTRDRLGDEILNGVLFVLIGLEFAVIEFPPGSPVAVVLALALCLLARYLIVGLPASAGRRWFGLPACSGLLLTSSGVRGSISVALALSMPLGPERNLILMLTYTVVVVSILVQGLTIGRLARALGLSTEVASEGRH